MDIVDKIAGMVSKSAPTVKTYIMPQVAQFRKKILQTRLNNLRENITQHNDLPQLLKTPEEILLHLRDHADYAKLLEIYVVLQQLQYIDVAVGVVIEYFDVNY